MPSVTAPTKPKVEPIDNTKLVEEFTAEGGRILHVRETPLNRGVTFAYKLKGKRIEVATAVTHTVDTFTKKVGTKTAIAHFRAGQIITLPVTDPKGVDYNLRDIVRFL